MGTAESGQRRTLISTPTQTLTKRAGPPKRELMPGAFFWLSAFYVVYCARPEDWIPGLKYIPLAKVTAMAAFIGLIASPWKTRRSFKSLPKESWYLLSLMGLLFVSAAFSPVWKGGAVSRTIDFSKVYVAWVLTYLLVTNLERLRRIIFIQSASVAVIAGVSIVKGHNRPRLEGVISGIYSNPNDLAFAIVLSLPFCLAFLVSAKGGLRKAGWAFAMLIMSAALFLTASRAGLIDLVIAGAVCLWHMGVKGRRFHLIVATGLCGLLLLTVSGGRLKERFEALSGEDVRTELGGKAYGSYEARFYLMRRAVEGIEHYPILGIGVNNFNTYSLVWHEVHMTYLQIAVEGGIVAAVLYLLFFGRGFSNLRRLRKMKTLDPEAKLLIGALHSSLVGFAVGACFAPEAYQFFPYFAVAYTSALLAMITEQEAVAARSNSRVQPQTHLYREIYAGDRRPDTVTIVR